MVQFQLEIDVFTMSPSHPLGRSRVPVIRSHGSSRLFCTKELLGTKAKTAITNVQNCQTPFSTMLLLTAQVRIPVPFDVMFPSFFYGFNISPNKKCCRFGGSHHPSSVFKNKRAHTPGPHWPPLTPSSASSTSADSVRKCRFSETNSSPRPTQL